MTFMRDAFFLTAMLGAGAVQASAFPPVTVLTTSQAKSSTDEDEDDPPAAQPAPTPAGTAATKPAAAPAKAEPAVAPTGAESQRLVSGAPLYNPNVAVHIVEQKAYSDSRRSEIILFPAAIQVNGKFTQHYGTMGSFVYHLQENFGLQVSGGYNWYSSESSFNHELVENFNQTASAATSLLWTWGVMGGVEVSPFYGKFTLFEGTLAHFSFVLNGGVGAGGTRLQIRPANEEKGEPATYGDGGIRFMASLGAGFRLQLGERFAFRLEVRDVVYSARVERVNGCDATDLEAIDKKQLAMQDVNTANVSSTCDTSKFSGTLEGTNVPLSQGAHLALGLVRPATGVSSDVLNNIGLYLGFSFLF